MIPSGLPAFIQDRDTVGDLLAVPGGWLRNQQVRVHALAKYQDGCVVANRKSGRYHRADDRGYRRATKARHVELFQSEADAQAAGYRRATP